MKFPLAPCAQALSACVLVMAAGAAAAQSFPPRPVTLVVPFAPGGGADVVARILTQETARRLGQPMIVDNRAGAGGSIAAAAVTKADADGHTLLFVTAGHAGMKALYSKLAFDPVGDFTPIIGLTTLPIVIAVNAQSKYRTLQDLVDDARQHPGRLNCAGGGGGATVTNLAFELMKSKLKLDIAAVPYKGSAPAITALLGGEIDCDSDAAAVVLPFLQSGKLRALAVMGAQRSPLLPEVPTVAETVLPEFSASVWYGVLAPRGTPQPVVDKLHRALSASLAVPEVTQRLGALTAERMDSGPAAFGRFIEAETRRWSDVIRQLGLQTE